MSEQIKQKAAVSDLFNVYRRGRVSALLTKALVETPSQTHMSKTLPAFRLGEFFAPTREREP